MLTRSQSKTKQFNKNRNLEEVNMEQLQEQLRQREEQIRVREQQLEQLNTAFQKLQARETVRLDRERVSREVKHMTTFTGTGDVTVNSFIVKKCRILHWGYDKLNVKAIHGEDNLQ